MKPILLFIISQVLLSCKSDMEQAYDKLNEALKRAEAIRDENDGFQTDTSNLNWSHIEPLTLPHSPDTLIREIELSKDLKISWDNNTHKIAHDAKWFKIENNPAKYKQTLIALITDTTQTLAYGCPTIRFLRKGQLAFLILDELNSIPYFEVFGVQFDVFIEGCEYPFDLIEYLLKEREMVQAKVNAYLSGK
ncbi:MAG: hypothetical protein HYZ14_09900 [Bacteroidetes bacterium]|nr:hypothetical protein [Bacteroidota bacterium]